MTAGLHIDRLATRIRGADAALAGQVRAALDGPLARDLDGVAGRALARAGLPAGAVVAIRRLALRLRVGAGVDLQGLARGWAQACETALIGTLTGAPGGAAAGTGGRPPLAGDAADADADLVWFPDPWAAEAQHLERRVAGLSDAWWAPQLAAGDAADGSVGAARAIAPAHILGRWLAEDPARAVATMAALVDSGARVVDLLDAPEAQALTRALLGRFAADLGEWARTPGAVRAGRACLDSVLAQAEGLGRHLLAQTGEGARARPWLAAALFAGTPALARVPVSLTEDFLDLALGEGQAGAGSAAGPAAAPTAAASTTLAGPAADRTSPQVQRQVQRQRGAAPGAVPEGCEVHAGGLLLLVRPLVKLGLLPGPDCLAVRLAELALAALRVVFAPLPAGEFAVAQERARPLLEVFAPGRDWRGPIAAVPILEPGPAAELLATLTAVIPAEVAFAPGAPRRVFGTPTPAIASAGELRLARLLLRPGVLRVSAWQAELTWPLGAADLALRRAGWDQDPGWVPWLGRNLSFRFGETP